MLKILMVDDSEPRVKIFKNEIQKNEYFNLLEITYCDTADKARTALLDSYDFMILDVLIPKKLENTPQALHSYNLLKDISNTKKKYIRPNLIIGLTADIAELGKYRETFFLNASIVLDGSLSNYDWIKKVFGQIDILLNAKQKSSQLLSKKMLISIHGIRTYGHWQNDLNQQISKYTKSFDFIEVKYGFYDLVSFFIPFMRIKKAKEIGFRLRHLIENNLEKDITVIAHSYGTLIVSEALRDCSLSKKVEKIILCGSPLPVNYKIDHILNSSQLTLNECGVNDIVLVAARCFILGLGDAGKSGFSLDNTRSFLNRYHSGGHDLYFKSINPEQSFADKYWLPLILSKSKPSYVDNRKNFIGEDIIDLLLKFLETVKPVFYIFAIAYILYLCWGI